MATSTSSTTHCALKYEKKPRYFVENGTDYCVPLAFIQQFFLLHYFKFLVHHESIGAFPDGAYIYTMHVSSIFKIGSVQE